MTTGDRTDWLRRKYAEKMYQLRPTAPPDTCPNDLCGNVNTPAHKQEMYADNTEIRSYYTCPVCHQQWEKLWTNPARPL